MDQELAGVWNVGMDKDNECSWDRAQDKPRSASDDVWGQNMAGSFIAKTEEHVITLRTS